MKRNMELVRHILMETENAEKGIQLLDLVTGQWDSEAIAYHVELMAAHRLLDAQVTRSASGRAIHCNIQGLTWDGCDYLDAIRDDRVWRFWSSVVLNGNQMVCRQERYAQCLGQCCLD